MKAVPSSAAFCKQLITMGIAVVFRWFSSSSLTVPKVPTTIGITVALTSHNFCTFNLKSWYFVFPSSFDVLISRNSPQHSISSSVWNVKFQIILYVSFSSTGSGWCRNHLSLHSISNLHRSQCNFFPSLLCLFLYWFPARTEQELKTN